VTGGTSRKQGLADTQGKGSSVTEKRDCITCRDEVGNIVYVP